MLTVDIEEAKVRLAELIGKAASGEAFVIAEAGNPLVKVVPFKQASRQGLFDCMRDGIAVDWDADLKDIGREEIIAMFEGDE